MRDWCDWFDSSEYWEYSSERETRYFATDDEADAFELEGLRLWLAVRAQTNGDYVIGYQSLTRQQRLWDPTELPTSLLPPEIAQQLKNQRPENENTAPPKTKRDSQHMSDSHEQRLADDPVYAAAYHRHLQELAPAPAASEAPITDDSSPESESEDVFGELLAEEDAVEESLPATEDEEDIFEELLPEEDAVDESPSVTEDEEDSDETSGAAEADESESESVLAARAHVLRLSEDQAYVAAIADIFAERQQTVVAEEEGASTDLGDAEAASELEGESAGEPLADADPDADEPLSHEQRLLQDPVYARIYNEHLERLASVSGD